MDMPSKKLSLLAWNSQTREFNRQSASNQKLLERLEAENAQLRGSVVELALQRCAKVPE
jgi:hypothetical protein